MSLFKKLFKFVEPVFGGGGGSIVEPIIRGGAAIIGEKLARDANNRAVTEGNRAAALRAAAIKAGNDEAVARLDEIIRAGEAGTAALQKAVSSDPSILSSTQQRVLDQTRRDTDARLASTGLRGSGRAVTAAIRDVDEGVRGRFIDQNQQRSDFAANQLHQPVAGAITGQANIAAGTGQALGTSAEQQNVNQAFNTQSNAGLRGQAIADIASIAADQLRTKPRARRFEEADQEKV